MSIRDRALAASVDTEIVNVPEWDAKVEVRGMSAKERVRFLQQQAAIRDSGKTNDYLYVDTVIAQTYDPDTGEPVFDPADRDTLAEGPARPLERIMEVAARISGLRDEDVAAAEERLQDDPTDGSSSS